MTKRIKLNGSWVTVKDEDIQDVPPEDVKPDPEEEEDEELDGEAKKIATSILKEINTTFKKEDTSALKLKVERLIEANFPQNSKLKQILNGKDLLGDRNELTKEEKIVGFFHAMVTKNEFALKALAEGADADGGYLVPNEFLAEVTRDLADMNVMRAEVRVIPMRRDKMDIPSFISGIDVFWTAENAAKSTTSARFGNNQLVAKKLAAIIYSSDELIDDSTEIDLVRLIIQIFSENVAEAEEKAIIVGNGTTQPQGIETARAAGTISSFAASGTSVDNMFQLESNLARPYRANAKLLVNSKGVMNLRKQKDTAGQYLWQPSLQDGTPAFFNGAPVIVSDFVPDRTVFYGDFKRGYLLGDRQKMTVKISQDTETAFTKDQTAIRVVHRVAGLVVLGNAIKAMTGF